MQDRQVAYMSSFSAIISCMIPTVGYAIQKRYQIIRLCTCEKRIQDRQGVCSCWNFLQMRTPAQIHISNFCRGAYLPGQKAGSNQLKPFSAGGVGMPSQIIRLLGNFVDGKAGVRVVVTLRKWVCRLKSFLYWENLQMGKPVQIRSSDFQPGVCSCWQVLFVNGYAGSNHSFTGKCCKWDSRFKSAQAIFSRGCAVEGIP